MPGLKIKTGYYFDEADALFGKRTNNKDAHDRYSNAAVSYLLQRIENYNGLAILSSNMKGNIDDAFIRRFQSMVYFPCPSVDERLRLWRKAFHKSAIRSDDVDLPFIAKKHILTGGDIQQIVKNIKDSIKPVEKITANHLLNCIESFY